MAARLTHRIAIVAVIASLASCAQTPTNPDNAKPVDLLEVYAKASKAYAEQNWGDSEKHYTTLIQNAPGESEPWFKLGNVYARTQRPGLAIEAYQETLIRDPKHVKAWHNMAVLQLRGARQSFSELQLLLEPSDALHAKSVKIQNTIDELVN